jgi:hypothetical protein
MYRKFDVTENLFFCIVHFSIDLNTTIVLFSQQRTILLAMVYQLNEQSHRSSEQVQVQVQHHIQYRVYEWLAAQRCSSARFRVRGVWNTRRRKKCLFSLARQLFLCEHDVFFPVVPILLRWLTGFPFSFRRRVVRSSLPCECELQQHPEVSKSVYSVAS